MKNTILYLLFLAFTMPCIAQTDTIPASETPQLQVPANRARIDNKTLTDFLIYIRIEDGKWNPATLKHVRNYIFLDDCGIMERFCKKEVAICTNTPNNCYILELKGSTAYQIDWDHKNSCWTIVEIKKS